MSKEIISCICMTCGIRNDHSTETGYCQNGHDAWLEYRDVAYDNEYFIETAKKFGLSLRELKRQFMNTGIKQLVSNVAERKKAIQDHLRRHRAFH